MEQMEKLAEFLDDLDLDVLQDITSKKDRKGYLRFVQNVKIDAFSQVSAMSHHSKRLQNQVEKLNEDVDKLGQFSEFLSTKMQKFNNSLEECDRLAEHLQRKPCSTSSSDSDGVRPDPEIKQIMDARPN